MDTNSNSNDDTGILLIGHGSRLPYNKEVVTGIAEKYAATQPDIPVEVCFMELAEPDIPSGFNKLKETGVKRIIVMPIFLAHGMHTKRDIPTILGLEVADIAKELGESSGHCHSHGHSHDHSHEEHGHSHHHHAHETESIEFDGEIIYTEPIGADDSIVELVSQRINPHL